MGKNECDEILGKMKVNKIETDEELSEFRDRVIQDTKSQIKEAILKIL